MFQTADRNLAEQGVDIHRHAASIADFRGQERRAGVREEIDDDVRRVGAARMMRSIDLSGF